MEGHMEDVKIKPDLDLFERQARNFSLIPLNGKRPFEQGWQQWCDTKRDFNRREFEGHNAGVCCGPASGVLVLDVDDPEAFNALLEGNGLSVPETLTVITGSGKPHYYFRYPQGGLVVRNKSFKHFSIYVANFTSNFAKLPYAAIEGIGSGCCWLTGLIKQVMMRMNIQVFQ